MARVEIPEAVYHVKSGKSQKGNDYSFVVQKDVYLHLGRRCVDIVLQHNDLSGVYPAGEYELDLESLIHVDERGNLTISRDRLRDARLTPRPKPAAQPRPAAGT